ncbi:MAG: hypothetical protein ACI92E_001667 [Oceanicoccus sp.]|jgi:hypothetical protein
MSIFKSRSTMKNMGEQSGFTVYSLDHRMYLLMPRGGASQVVISAHGGRQRNTSTFKVPSDTILRFYSDDLKITNDPGFKNFYQGEAAPKEVVSEGDNCYDYTLTKYQGSHNKQGETYGSIAKVVNETLQAHGELMSAAAQIYDNFGSSIGSSSKSDYDRFRKRYSSALQGAANNKMIAALTIRNRTFHSHMSLNTAIELVKSVAPEIVLFDCLFCRCLASGTESDDVMVVRR